MKLLTTLLLSLASFQALADVTPPPNGIPEPGALALLAVGAAAAALAWSRKRKK